MPTEPKDGWRSRTDRDFDYRSRSSKPEASSFEVKGSRISLIVAGFTGVAVALVALYSFQTVVRPSDTEVDTKAELREAVDRAQAASLQAAEAQHNLEKLSGELAESRRSAEQVEQLRIDVKTAHQRVCKLENDLRYSQSRRSSYCKGDTNALASPSQRPASAP